MTDIETVVAAIATAAVGGTIITAAVVVCAAWTADRDEDRVRRARADTDTSTTNAEDMDT